MFAVAERVAADEPARHQIEELPVMAVHVTEHQCQRVRCPDCGARRTGQLPADVAASGFGPRLQAAVVTLAVRNRISRRDTVELCEQLFSSRISTGTVDAILTRAGDALSEPCADLLERVRGAPALNIDETGWRLRGGQRALWGAFTERHAILTIEPDRHEDRAKRLLADTEAIVTLGSLVGLQPSTRPPKAGLLVAPAARLRLPRRGPRDREGTRRVNHSGIVGGPIL